MALKTLDRFDHLILKVLSADGRLPLTELARQIGMSKSPCQSRVRRLENDGYIKGYRAVINQQLIGNAHVAFVQVKLSNTTESALAAFNEQIRKIREVESCHLIAGAFDYLIKVRTSDIKTYRALLAEDIASLPYLAHSSTFVSMEDVIDS